jgi:hypothetical protein
MNTLERYDRTYLCQHSGMLLPATPEGTRLCLRCGKMLKLAAPSERFTQPVSLAAGGLKRKSLPR